MSACILQPSESSGVVYKNDTIPDDILSEIKVLDETFIESVYSNDADLIYDRVSDKINNKEEQVPVIIDMFHNKFEDKEYYYLDTYYIISETTGVTGRILAESENREYLVSSNAINGEIFISLILFEFPHEEVMLTLMYTRRNDDWEIETFYMNDYTFWGMNSLDFLDKSNNMIKEEKMLPALLYAYEAAFISGPSPLMQYISDIDFEKNYYQLKDDVEETYKFHIQ